MGNNSSEFFESTMRGLGEVLEHAKGERELRASSLTVTEPKTYMPEDIRGVRQKHGLSQALAAALIGVSAATWEKWENGLAMPPGPAHRLLHIVDNHFGMLWGLGIISRETAVDDKGEEV